MPQPTHGEFLTQLFSLQIYYKLFTCERFWASFLQHHRHLLYFLRCFVVKSASRRLLITIICGNFATTTQKTHKSLITLVMADIDIINRIKYLMKELNYRQVDFAHKIDVDTSNLSKYLNGRLPISDSLINRLVVNLGVSKQWLEDGSDLPFAKSTPAAAMSASPALAMQGTPVYDIDVTAGSMLRSRMFTDDHVVGCINLPEFTGSDSLIVRVSGDSMSPVIRNGDLIVLRKLTNIQYIMWGQVYVVVMDDFRMLKYVRRHDNPALVTLRSANPAYDDIEVARADIRDLMLVQSVIHIDKLI